MALSKGQMKQYGVKLGDFVLVTNPATGQTVIGIIGDVGNKGTFKELSPYSIHSYDTTITNAFVV